MSSTPSTMGVSLNYLYEFYTASLTKSRRSSGLSLQIPARTVLGAWAQEQDRLSDPESGSSSKASRGLEYLAYE